MYRYLVFSYYGFYPGGGMDDCELKTNELEKAKAYLENEADGDYKYIYDVQEDKRITIQDAH